MKRTMALLITIACLAIAGLATTGTAAASGKGCPHGQVNTIVGTMHRDILPGTDCADVIYGLRGNDLIIGHNGEDRLLGGRGNDQLRGVDGFADQIRGGRGRDDRCRGDQLDVFTGCEHILRFFVTPAK